MASSNSNTKPSVTLSSKHEMATLLNGQWSHPSFSGPITPLNASLLGSCPSTWHMVWNQFSHSTSNWQHSNIMPLHLTYNLLTICTCQLEKCPTNLTAIHKHIIASRFASVCQFEKQHMHSIHNYDFNPGTLILICNIGSDMNKTKPHYYDLMIIL